MRLTSFMARSRISGKLSRSTFRTIRLETFYGSFSATRRAFSGLCPSHMKDGHATFSINSWYFMSNWNYVKEELSHIHYNYEIINSEWNAKSWEYLIVMKNLKEKKDLIKHGFLTYNQVINDSFHYL